MLYYRWHSSGYNLQNLDDWERKMRDQLDPDKNNKWITGFLASSWEVFGEPPDFVPILERTYNVCKKYRVKCILRCLVDYSSGRIPRCVAEQWDNWKRVLNALPFSDIEIQAYSDFYCEQAPWNPTSPKLDPILNNTVTGEKVAEFKLYDETIHGGNWGGGHGIYPQMDDPIPQCWADFWKDRFTRHKNNGVIGVCTWLGKGCCLSRIDAWPTNDEINISSLYAFGSLAWDVDQDVESEVLYNWAEDKYGRKAAPHIAHYLVNTEPAWLYQTWKMDYTNEGCRENPRGYYQKPSSFNRKLDPRAKAAMDEMYNSLYAAKPYLPASVYNEYKTRTDKLVDAATCNCGGYLPFPYAKALSPADGAERVDSDAVLRWSAGKYAALHDVYLGTDFNDVNTATRTSAPNNVLVSKGQTSPNYTPTGGLELGETYYWRIDEVNEPNMWKGSVWSFTVKWGDVILAENITATASSEHSYGGTVSSAENTVNRSGLDVTGLFHTNNWRHNWLSATGGGGDTNPNPGTVTGAAWIRFDFDKVYELGKLWVWNDNQDQCSDRGLRNVSIEYSTTGGNDSGEWIKLGEYEFAKASELNTYLGKAEADFGGAEVKHVVITAHTTNGNWGTGYNDYGLSGVYFYTVPPEKRKSTIFPRPRSGG